MEMDNYMKTNTIPSRDNEEESDQTTNEVGTKKLIKTFGSYTTLHGFHFLSDSNSAIRRIVWLLLMIICLAIMAVNVKENYAKLQRHDSLVTKDVEQSKRLLFPAVSICNQNMLLKTKIRDTDAQFYLDSIDDLKAEYMGNVTTEQALHRARASFDIEKTVREAGHNLSTMMKLCMWRGQKCGVENFTTFVSFYRGLCYTFNSGAPGHPLLDVTSSGISQALNLIIDVQPEEYYGPFSYEGTGLKVLLHEQKEWPEMENLGVDVTPGYNTNIRIQRSKVINLEPPYKPPCGTRKLVTTKTYSTSTCFHECFQKQLMDACNCRFLGMPVEGEFNVSNFCNTEEMRNCILPTTDKLNPSECNCPVQCEKIKYGLQLSSAYFPSPHFWDTVYQLLNESANETTSDTLQGIIRRLLKLNIFYESLSTEVTKERPAYDIHDFGSDMGGSMGLFLGCSVLTMCEFLDLIIMAFVGCYTATKRPSKKINHEPVATRDSV
ncbi:acid-sensing ion channel 3-like isoform X2 [Oculina patagonica]